MPFLCRLLGHDWLVHITPFDLETPFHRRFCGRNGCDAEEIVYDGMTIYDDRPCS